MSDVERKPIGVSQPTVKFFTATPPPDINHPGCTHCWSSGSFIIHMFGFGNFPLLYQFGNMKVGKKSALSHNFAQSTVILCNVSERLILVRLEFLHTLSMRWVYLWYLENCESVHLLNVEFPKLARAFSHSSSGRVAFKIAIGISYFWTPSFSNRCGLARIPLGTCYCTILELAAHYTMSTVIFHPLGGKHFLRVQWDCNF